jgi:hypothetical protein
MDQVCEHRLSSTYRRHKLELPPPALSLLTSAIDRFDPLKQTESLEPTPSQSKSLVAYQFDL